MNTFGKYEVVYDGIVWHKMTYRKYYKPLYIDETDLAYNRLLHQYIYLTRIGPIPPNYHIHHIDGNQYNNDPSNLQALPASIHYHMKRHKYTMTPEGSARLRLSLQTRNIRKHGYILHDYLTQLVQMSTR